MTDPSGAAESGATPPPGSDEDPERVVIRDKRRVDQPGAADGGLGDVLDGESPDLDAVSYDPVLAQLQQQVDERTADVSAHPS